MIIVYINSNIIIYIYWSQNKITIDDYVSIKLKGYIEPSIFLYSSLIHVHVQLYMYKHVHVHICGFS